VVPREVERLPEVDGDRVRLQLAPFSWNVVRLTDLPSAT
jgi:hypothetical protein